MTPRPHPRLLLAAALSVAFTLGAAACGDDEPDASGDAGTTSTAGDAQPDYGGPGDGESKGEKGTIVAADFSLTDLTVAPGEEIVLRNDGETAHTATADDGEFDLGEVAASETSEPQTAPDEPGEYGFHCEIHENMTATLTVEE